MVRKLNLVVTLKDLRGRARILEEVHSEEYVLFTLY